METQVEHRADRQRFVATTDGFQSFLRYARVDDETLDLLTTYVHRDLRGRGIGERLVVAALEYAREEGCSVIPTCWFVDTVLERHPRFRDLVTTR